LEIIDFFFYFENKVNSMNANEIFKAFSEIYKFLKFNDDVVFTRVTKFDP